MVQEGREYLSAIVNSVICVPDAFRIGIGSGKYLFSATGNDRTTNDYFAISAIYDSICDIDAKIKYAFEQALTCKFPETIIEYNPLAKPTRQEDIAMYHVENMVFRTSILWDLLAQGKSMETYYILYNPMAGDGSSKKYAECMPIIFDRVELIDMTRITNYRAFLYGLRREDILVIVGGDGTLNRFVNDTDGIEISQEILYLPAGTGNDFAKDLGKDGYGNPFEIGRYLKDLPSVEVKGGPLISSV